jgi:hypothetical protein
MTKEKDQFSVEFIFSLTALVTALPHILLYQQRQKQMYTEIFNLLSG